MNRILGHLCIACRLFLIALAFSLPLLVLFALMLKSMTKDIDFCRKEMAGNEYLRPLVGFLAGLPRYERGDANAGNDIKKSLNQLMTLRASIGEDLKFAPEELKARNRESASEANIAALWDKISSNPADDSARRQMAQELSAALQTAIQHAGDTSNLILDPDLDSYYMMDAVLLKLPQAHEMFANFVRSASTDISKLSSAERLRLAVLLDRIEEIAITGVEQDVNTVLSEDPNFYGVCPGLEKRLQEAKRTYIQQVRLFLDAARPMLYADGASANMQISGSGATGAVDIAGLAESARQSCYSFWGATARELDNLLKMREAELSSSRTWAVGIVTAALLFSITLVIIIARSITIPLLKTVEFASIIRRGEFDRRLNLDTKDETGALARAMNEMAQGLHMQAQLAQAISEGDLQKEAAIASDRDLLGNSLAHMLVQLNDVFLEFQGTSRAIAAEATQLSDASQSMTNGVNEQAAALEEISASMNQIDAQARSNAQNATEACRIAASTRDAVRAGADEVRDLARQMGEMEKESREIAQIVKAIDDIAFQTNLLALNAAVEAARAGKHGKGFAVVAEEVRALADRSSKAASETSRLIQATLQRVNQGAERSEHAATEFSNVVARMEQMDCIVREIATASQEQSQGVGQINAGISQISTFTQDSFACAQETAAAAEELSSAACELEHELSKFRLREGAAITQTPCKQQRMEQSAKLRSHREPQPVRIPLPARRDLPGSSPAPTLRPSRQIAAAV